MPVDQTVYLDFSTFVERFIIDERSDSQASGEIKKKFFMSIQGEMGTALVMSYLYSKLSKFTIISG